MFLGIKLYSQTVLNKMLSGSLEIDRRPILGELQYGLPCDIMVRERGPRAFWHPSRKKWLSRKNGFELGLVKCCERFTLGMGHVYTEDI